ncbi:MAG: EVE domain-containing protein [Cytophagaceae bacterium]|nr:EVE domain-containing protein [Cytophagaceae bacterium]
MNYWLVKSEPSTYSFDQLLKDKQTVWDGVRNFAARNHLRAMKKGDLVLFYHSNEGKDIVGIAKVLKENYPDPTAKEGDWSVVELGPHKQLKQSVTLEQVKKEKRLKDMALIRLSRLSVQPVKQEEFNLILELANS